MSYASVFMRIGTRKNDRKKNAGLIIPGDVVRYQDISYGEDKMNLLDVYRPRKIEGKLPVIVSVHGGGWVYGDKELYQHYCMSLAQRGFAVVNFTYCLSPEHKFPCQLEDTVKVFAWVLEHAKEYGMDTDNIFAVGDSAGGHILSLFCILCTNPEYAKHYAFQVPEGFVPKAVGLNCGAYDMEVLADSGVSNAGALMEDIFPRGGIREELRFVSPTDHVNQDFPPCFITTANHDFLKDQPKLLMKKLDKFGVKYKYKMYGDDTNKLEHVFHLDMRNVTGKLFNDEQCVWFKTFI
uniref:alpha/beta hydrolase n=1 Tax=Agathobacter sp. TaxID=2021311 RepID=UPI0040567764